MDEAHTMYARNRWVSARYTLSIPSAATGRSARNIPACAR